MNIKAEIKNSLSRAGLLLSLCAGLYTQVQAADYSITTAGGAVVITDLTGGSETLTLGQSGSNLRITMSPNTRTYSLNGGADIAFASPPSIPLAGLSSITVNTGAGNDIIGLGGFTAALPTLSLSGGTGDDAIFFNGNISFAPGANLDLDLQNDDLNPGADAVSVNTGSDVLLSGAGIAVIRVSKNIRFTPGSILRTENGNLTLEANQQAVATTGNFHGVWLESGTVVESTGNGAVQVSGTGGNTGQQFGVYVSNAILRGGTGAAIRVQGTGGASATDGNAGVMVGPSAAFITSRGADVFVTGMGGGNGSSRLNSGVRLDTGNITAGGNGLVTITGTGAASTGHNNYGVLSTGIITSGGGNVRVTGQGGGTLFSIGNIGVHVNMGTLSAGGTGTVYVNGTGGASQGNSNYGVLLYAPIQSAGGDVTVYGTGGGSGSSQENIGVFVYNTTLSAGGSGLLTVNGTGGATTAPANHGIRAGNNGRITTSGGNISVSGLKGSSSLNAADILLETGGNISTTGTAAEILLSSPSGGTYPLTATVDVNNASATQFTRFASGSRLNLDLDGTTANVNHQQLNAVGQIDLNGAALSFQGSTVTPAVGQSFTLVNNDGTDPVSGTFSGLPEGALISNFLGSALSAQITYQGGTGNDVVLRVISCAAPSFTTCPDPTPTALLAASAGPGCTAVVNYNPVVSGTTPVSFSYTFSGATTGSGTGTGSGAAFNTGNTLVSITASNACGISRCSFTVRVADRTAPVIAALPAPVVIDCGTAPVFATATATDNCGPVSLTYADQIVPGSCPGAFTQTRTWTATDAAGNASTASQIISVQDITAPVLSCRNVQVNLDASGQATVSLNDLVASVTDHCSTPVLSASALSFGCGQIGTNNVTVTAADACGNTSTCTAVVTVNCNPPTVTASASVSTLYFYGGAVHDATGAVVNTFTLTGTVSSACPATLSWSGSGISGTGTTLPVPAPASPGSYTYVFTASQGGSCSATASVTVCVIDASGGTTNKVTLAHGNGNGGCNTLSVSINALAMHLAHGDWIGTCAAGSNPPCSSARLAQDVALAHSLEASPNPFGQVTQLRFSLETAGFATLNVYDMAGKYVATVFAGEVLAGETYTADFTPAATLSTGMYLVRLENSTGESLTHKIILTR